MRSYFQFASEAVFFASFFVIRLVPIFIRGMRAGKGGREMVTLKIPTRVGGSTGTSAAVTSTTAPLESLSTACCYARIVRGFGRGEEIISCGYVYPPMALPFSVRECTDYKPKRSSGVSDKTEHIVVELSNVANISTAAAE
jgi:hypothetical protein